MILKNFPLCPNLKHNNFHHLNSATSSKDQKTALCEINKQKNLSDQFLAL